MLNTKECILETALRLFASKGYEAVSVNDIAGELCITKGALYRHYRNKRDIFDTILTRMEQHDAEHAEEHALPDKPVEEMGNAYRSATAEQILEFSRTMFRYWTEDGFAANFRRMLTIEQFRNPEMGKLYQQYLSSGPLAYLTDLFSGIGLQDAPEKAAGFYGLMFLMYSVYDGAEDKRTVSLELNRMLKKNMGFLKDGETVPNRNAERVVIRREQERDYRDVENLIRESFWNVYRPGCQEHYVIHCLRNDPAFVPELDVVMEKDGRLIGQNMFMHAVIRADNGREIPIMTMGPICIAPEFKRMGYGKQLLDWSLKRAAELGCGALCFEGNIGFYGKSGFVYASEFGIRYHGLPEDADASFFLCKELLPGYLKEARGEYAPPEGYFAAERNPEDFAAFDAQFPLKEKQVLPGQIF